jgi:hypothetical protein
MSSTSPSVSFEVTCPNNHDQTVSFTRNSFESALKAGDPLFHCNTCDTDWNPSHEQIADMRGELAAD